MAVRSAWETIRAKSRSKMGPTGSAVAGPAMVSRHRTATLSRYRCSTLPPLTTFRYGVGFEAVAQAVD